MIDPMVLCRAALRRTAIGTVMMAGVGFGGVAAADPLAPADPPVTAAAAGDEDPDQERQDILILGKSYGRAVGKTVTPLKDVPNTVTVIDREQIEAQNLFTLEDALTATNGVTVNGVGSEDPSFLSRGFTINNYLVDGTPTMAFGFPAVVPDLFFYDRMEVLRGPAGLFSGSGNPAGSINLVRKRPLDEVRLQAVAGYGSFDNLRLEVDGSTPLGEHAGLRVGVMAQDQDQFFDIAHRNRVAGYLTTRIDIGERTSFTVGGSYDRFRPAIQSGLPGIIGGADGSDGRLLDVRRSTYLGADWNRFESEVWTGWAELTHRISDRWALRASALATDVDRVDIYSYIGNQPVTPTNGVTNQIAFIGDSGQKTYAFDMNGVGSFPAFGRDQTLILGADYQSNLQTSAYDRLSNFARIDVYNPVSPPEPPLTGYVLLPPYAGPNGPVAHSPGRTTTEVEQYGLYGQIRLSPLEGLTLVGGGRMTWWDTENTTLAPLVPSRSGYSIEGQFTPYAGLVWDVTGNLNVYASYADSFTPQAAPAGRRRPDGEPVKPLSGQQFEAGTKLSLMDDRLLLSIAGYQIEQTNRLFNDPNLADVVLQIGKVRARGIEAEATGEIVPGWKVNGGYSLTRTRYLEDANPVFEGLSLVPVVPEHMVKVFTNYAPPAGPLAGASVGGAVTWFSSTYGGNPAVYNAAGALVTRSTIVRQGSYAVVDLRAGYKLSEQVGLSVNVNNVLDRTYYARISSTGRGNFYGSPRTVFATLRYSFP